jgi:RimJ/RimL family protein N-acetyltransferase
VDGAPEASLAEVTLRDGRSVRVRVIRPEDRLRLAAAFDRLSPRSRRQRFLGATAHLSDELLRYFTEIDHNSHEALGAFDDDGRLVGIAEFVRARPGARSAEVAIVVVDEWQACGLGSVLVELLTERARTLGVESFSAYCFADNAKVIDLLDRVGPAEHHPSGANVVEMQMNLRYGPDASLLEGITIAPRAQERSARDGASDGEAPATCSPGQSL